MTRPSCFCHYERSEVIQKQVLLVRRLLLSFHSIAMTCSGVSSRTQCGDLLAMGLLQLFKLRNDKNCKQVACDEIASTTPQVWLVAGSHLGFAKKSFHSIASDKNRAVSVELVSRLPRRVFYTARNDKELESKNYDQVAGQWDCFCRFTPSRVTKVVRNDKVRGQVFSRVPRIAGQRTCGKYKRRVVITSVLGMEARQGSDSLDFFWTFWERG